MTPHQLLTRYLDGASLSKSEMTTLLDASLKSLNQALKAFRKMERGEVMMS